MSASGKFLRWPWLASTKSRENVAATGVNDARISATAEDRSLSLAMLAEECAESVVICDAKQRVVFANVAFESLLGFAAHELIGEDFSLVHAATQTLRWGAIEIRGSWRGSVMSRHKNGEVIASWLGVAASRNGEGSITHYVCLFASDAQVDTANDRLLQFMNLR